MRKNTVKLVLLAFANVSHKLKVTMPVKYCKLDYLAVKGAKFNIPCHVSNGKWIDFKSR